MHPIFTGRETKFPKPLLHFQSQAHLLKTSCVPGALPAVVGIDLRSPWGAVGARSLCRAGHGTEERVITLGWGESGGRTAVRKAFRECQSGL